MPFNRTDPMKERVKFILAWEKRWQESQGGRIAAAAFEPHGDLAADSGFHRRCPEGQAPLGAPKAAGVADGSVPRQKVPQRGYLRLRARAPRPDDPAPAR